MMDAHTGEGVSDERRKHVRADLLLLQPPPHGLRREVLSMSNGVESVADSSRAVDVSVQAMERMYAEVMAVKDELKANMRNPGVDATHNQELLLKARGTDYTPL